MVETKKHNLLLYAKKEFEKLGYECWQEGNSNVLLFNRATDDYLKILVTTKEEGLVYRIDVVFYYYGGTLQDAIDVLTKSYKRAEEDIEIVKAKMETTDVEKEAIFDILKECGVPSGIIKAIEGVLK